MPGKDVHFNVSILTSFVFIFIEYLIIIIIIIIIIMMMMIIIMIMIMIIIIIIIIYISKALLCLASVWLRFHSNSKLNSTKRIFH